MDYRNNLLRDADLSTGLTLGYPHNPLGDAVWAFAQGELIKANLSLAIGKTPSPVNTTGKLTDYQCTDFVHKALQDAGAKPGNVSDPTHYVWGDEVTRVIYPDPPVPEQPEWGTWQAGDIIQFWDAYFQWGGPNGGHFAVETPGKGEPDVRRHTAIILRPPLVSINPKYISSHPWDTWLVHQNDNKLPYVTSRLVYLRYLQQGQFFVYRPVPP